MTWCYAASASCLNLPVRSDTEKGLGKNSFMADGPHRFRTSWIGSAEINNTRMPGRISLRISANWPPPIYGIATSLSKMSMGSSGLPLARSNASTPFPATRILYPSRFSRKDTNSSNGGSSSTTNTVGAAFMFDSLDSQFSVSRSGLVYLGQINHRTRAHNLYFQDREP